MSAFIPVALDRWTEMVQASAEVGPLRNKVSDLSTQLELRQVEIDHLRAEVERLRKAGDAMLGTMLWAAAKNPEGPAEKRIAGWLAAKGEANAS